MDWDIGRTGRKWTGLEGLAKLERLPGRLELIGGKVCINETERRELLAGLLENLGLDAVVQFGRVEDWQQAIAARAEAEHNPPVSVAAKTPVRHWNCRVIEFPSEGETWYAVHEVYYEHGVPVGYGESPAEIGWTKDDGHAAGLNRLEKLKEALRKPVLKVSDFQNARAKVALLTRLAKMTEDSGGCRDMVVLSAWLDGWLAQPHRELGGATPAQALASESGRQQVDALLERTRDGLPGKLREMKTAVFEIYSQVVLSVALPTLPLKPGARGVVVHVHGAGEAYEVEFMTDDGQTLDVATVPPTHLSESATDFHACIDSPEQDPVLLSDPAVVEPLQQDWAKREVISAEDQLPLPKPTSQGEQE